MGKTIIQTIGPLYGESVNGTVFGRPNGSIYIPSSNTITLSLAESNRYIVLDDTYYKLCNSVGVPAQVGAYVVAESQDLQNYIQFQIGTSADFSTIIGTRSRVAGAFNITGAVVAQGADLPAIEDETTYYLRAVLMSANGDPVAVSSAVEVVGVVV